MAKARSRSQARSAPKYGTLKHKNLVVAPGCVVASKGCILPSCATPSICEPPYYSIARLTPPETASGVEMAELVNQIRKIARLKVEIFAPPQTIRKIDKALKA